MRPPSLKFTAKHIRREIRNGVAQLEFTNAVFDYTRYLLLQKTLRPSEKEVSLGQDAPYIEIDDQKYSAYSKTLRVEVATDAVRFLLDPEACKGLSGTSEILIELDSKLDRATISGLPSQLRMLLGPENVRAPDPGGENRA